MKVQEPKFTDIQNMLTEIHDRLFPESKHISPEDVAFLRSKVRAANPGVKLVPKAELEAVQAENTRLRKALEIAKNALRVCDITLKAAKPCVNGGEHMNERIAEEALEALSEQECKND